MSKKLSESGNANIVFKGVGVRKTKLANRIQEANTLFTKFVLHQMSVKIKIAKTKLCFISIPKGFR